jgi:hypothetical protein
MSIFFELVDTLYACFLAKDLDDQNREWLPGDKTEDHERITRMRSSSLDGGIVRIDLVVGCELL